MEIVGEGVGRCSGGELGELGLAGFSYCCLYFFVFKFLPCLVIFWADFVVGASRLVVLKVFS